MRRFWSLVVLGDVLVMIYVIRQSGRNGGVNYSMVMYSRECKIIIVEFIGVGHIRINNHINIRGNLWYRKRMC